MTSSLFAALSGLKAHQGWMDVIGNNLANTNTPGFKSSSATFADHFSRTMQFASGPGANRGGRNPVQIGQGVRLADIARNFSQGALTNTGRTFDVALQGNGFFAVSNGVANLYSRVGTFGLDADSFLVDQRNGNRVLSPSGSTIHVDTQSLLPPEATSSASLVGNLPKEVGGPLAAVLTATTAFAEGSPASITSNNAGPFTVPAGETWTMQVTVGNDAPQTVSVTSAGGTVTAADLASAVDALSGVGASVDGSGRVVVTTDRTGAPATLKITPGAPGADLASLAGFSTALVIGAEAPATATTALNDLPANVTDYQDGDRIHVSGRDSDGTPIEADFVFGAANDGTTIGDLASFVDSLYAGASAEIDDDGKLVLQADVAGTSSLSIAISNDAAAAGQTQWSNHALSVTTAGTAADKVTSALEVHDPSGVAHLLTFTFERQADLTWRMTPSLAAGTGTVLSAPLSGLTFSDDGSPIGLGSVDRTIVVQFTGQSAPQSIDLDLGTDGGFTGLTQFGAPGVVSIGAQDGYGVGELASMSVDGDGSILGVYTNGQIRSLGAIGVATFTNPEGLTHVGDSLFSQSLNSGNAVLGIGDSGSAGQVVGGSIENSNVDTAEQFVRLIEAQRGFQANARVITAQNEVLRDMVNLI